MILFLTFFCCHSLILDLHSSQGETLNVGPLSRRSNHHSRILQLPSLQISREQLQVVNETTCGVAASVVHGCHFNSCNRCTSYKFPFDEIEIDVPNQANNIQCRSTNPLSQCHLSLSLKFFLVGVGDHPPLQLTWTLLYRFSSNPDYFEFEEHNQSVTEYGFSALETYHVQYVASHDQGRRYSNRLFRKSISETLHGIADGLVHSRLGN